MHGFLYNILTGDIIIIVGIVCGQWHTYERGFLCYHESVLPSHSFLQQLLVGWSISGNDDTCRCSAHFTTHQGHHQHSNVNSHPQDALPMPMPNFCLNARLAHEKAIFRSNLFGFTIRNERITLI